MPRRTIILLALILATHAALLVECAINKSVCFDEGPHLSAGLAYLRYGEMSIYNLSPPLLRMWAAIPAYLDGADVPMARPFRLQPDNSRHWNYFNAFQEANLASVHRYVLWGRFALMPLSLVAAAIIFFWARKLYGDAGALIACAAWSLNPFILAQGSTLGTDMGVSVAILAACGLWTWFARSGNRFAAVAAGLTIALAHTMKFTALLLWPMIVAIAIVEILGKRSSWRRSAAGLAIALMLTFICINAVYGFRMMFDRLDSFTFNSQPMQRMQRILPGWLPLPFHRDMINGFDAQKKEADAQYVSVLWGRAYFGSDWRYYPWLLFCKTPLGGLVLFALACISFFVKRPSSDELPLLIASIGLFVGMQFAAEINISLRYLLPAYAPAIILLGRCAQIRWMKPLAIAAILLVTLETFASTPRFNSYCNFLMRFDKLDVPEFDGGQSLLDLRDWMIRNNQPRITLLYFGSVDPGAYGIHGPDPFANSSTPYVAMSREFLNGVPARTPRGFVFLRIWRSLRIAKPVADLGGVLVYRSDDVLHAQPQPWIVPITSWQQAMQDPAINPIQNFPK